MGCFAQSQRFSCPEITDEVCSVVADKEVIAVAYMSELQRIKGISIFSKKTGIEISNIQVRYFKLYSSTICEIMIFFTDFICPQRLYGFSILFTNSFPCCGCQIVSKNRQKHCKFESCHLFKDKW